MKSTLLFATLYFSAITISAQDAKSILKMSYHKCQSVQNGYFEMTKRMKYMTGKDTAETAIKGSFKKVKGDTIYTAIFNFKLFRQNEFTGDLLYTGDNLVFSEQMDSTAVIMSRVTWAKEIKARLRNQKFYSPLISAKSTPLPNDSQYIDTSYIFQYIGEEIVNNNLCYHVQINQIAANDSTELMKQLRNELHFWINKTDSIPVQYSIAYDMVTNTDTMFQYELNSLTKYETGQVLDEKQFNLSAISDYYKVKDFVPYKNIPLLPKDTLAPNWELISTDNKKVSLNDLKGSLVLVDFFYKSCYPCMLALPGLQALSEKYQSQGLSVIGIDPFDTKDDDIVSFLKKRGITYTVLLGGKDVAKDYRVSAYPTLYLIDRNGKIIYVQNGYSKDLEKILEDSIKENL